MENIGAKFLRADLHIHSFGEFGSYDVKDTTMTPLAIVDTAIEKKLSVISITDHNEIQNSHTAIEYSREKNILVIPGVEISTTQGHLLVYFETYKNLRDFYGNLTISGDKKICNQGIVECLEFAKIHNGFGVLAHIELPSGFELTIGRFGPPIEEVLKHENLLGLEISSKSSLNFYTDEDESKDRKRLLKLRKEHLGYDDSYTLPKLMSSDSHTLNRLGTNADGETKLTRFKVDELNFHSIKIALLTHESRVRLENVVPDMRPIIESIKIEGGLLDNIQIRLSSNLTCIIGSRGAGKSTLLEAIRETSGNNSRSTVVDSEVWPQKIKLRYIDEANQVVDFTREKNSEVQNITDPINGISSVDIETYGQGETADTIQHSDENPKVLVDFLDSFLKLDAKIVEDIELTSLLLENQSEAKKIRIGLLSFKETEKALKNEQRKLENLQKEKAGELVKYQNALIKERGIRSELIKNLNQLVKNYKEILSDDDTFTNFDSLVDTDIIVGKDFFKKVKEIVADFSKVVKTKSTELNAELSAKITELNEQLNNWKEKEKSIQDKIDAKKIELEKQGIPFDLGKINQISKDIVDYQKIITKLNLDKKKLKDLSTERDELLDKRLSLKNDVYAERNKFAKKANADLKNTIDGFFISIKYKKGKFSPEFEALLRSKMDWRNFKKSKYISENLSPLDFVDVCKKGNKDTLTGIKDDEGNQLFSDFEAANIIEKTIKDNNFEDYESLGFEDFPSIIVTKAIKDENGEMKYYHKPISQLSLGQQHSVLLGILLLSDSNKPLIIDQPEDNLDSEFIYKTIVKNLRKIKEQRQVIIVTHNANIAVLGDAELIVPLKSTSIKSHVLSSGSIDREETRGICCEILEGGKRAFIQRQDIYGIK
ncbi:TrlF family AAA-like ATPase [Ancylomarina sp. 16SWW S1-10-2]|uniref:TrlF family AAA-like ATPase n=1 Tax=Ancylomarina sp. 16SWW S1-10-2 TaxID=2499681 RepID=UPI0012AD88E0|nr:AAA family ATPase [Ancylomarina sp. 16SWW S1-10-2]MRT94432.1 PHP domain-containing protein [Ancylomarina sp. 16SWW S1-10-2]